VEKKPFNQGWLELGSPTRFQGPKGKENWSWTISILEKTAQQQPLTTNHWLPGWPPHFPGKIKGGLGKNPKGLESCWVLSPKIPFFPRSHYLFLLGFPGWGENPTREELVAQTTLGWAPLI